MGVHDCRASELAHTGTLGYDGVMFGGDLSGTSDTAQLAELFEEAPDALVVTDRFGEVVLANRRARRWFVPGDRLADQLPEGILRALVAGDRLGLRSQLANPDGSLSKVDIRGAALSGDQLELSIRDVTNDEELEQRAAALQKTEAVGVLAAGLAHNVNNMLASVVAHLDVALLKLAGQELPVVDSALHAAVRGIESVSGVVRKLLEVARPEAPELERVELASLLERQLELVRPSLGTEITLETSLEAGLTTLVDRSIFSSIVVNLLVNARDAMPDGGTVSLALKGDGVQRATLTVSDCGCGIAPEQQQRIFEPFFTTKRHGSGLGLSTVRAGVAALGWDIEVTSAPGRGTTFRMIVPLSGATSPVRGERAQRALETEAGSASAMACPRSRLSNGF